MSLTSSDAFLVKFSAIFGVIPYYNLQTHQLVNPKLFKLHCLLLACVSPIVSITSVYLRHCFNFNNTSRNFVILDVLYETVSVILFEVAVLSPSFWNTRHWQELFQLLQQLETKHPSKRNVFTWLLLLFGTGYLVLLFAVEFQYNLNYRYKSYSFLASYFYVYVGFVQLVVISNVSLWIRTRYRSVRTLLQNVRYSDIAEVSGIIKECTILYLKMDKIIDKVNRVFGWAMLVILIQMGVLSLDTLTFYSLYTQRSSLTTEHIVIYGGFTLLTVIWPVILILCCDAAVEESKKLLPVCYWLEQVLPRSSKEMEVLKSLENIVKSKPAKMTAAGFFDIDRSTLVSVFSATTMYYLVCIQFNKRD
ncbi:hypothetical protein NQ315_012611 [Exocentrus adspersus]|uniref:Gustatory receptor n=1 Tax=Exocentrus adspersus TaxID=1586481 RepID=A0AAV8VT84_9CUCU|nr:hypothetical protein NQ315_012611 [Exocentrus adspersus]